MNKNKKAEMGMGTLILFIAMILVAAVAAGVLISTTGSLQNKALATGKATTAQVGTAMEAVEVFAEDASSSNNLEDFYETIRLTSGSEVRLVIETASAISTLGQRSHGILSTQGRRFRGRRVQRSAQRSTHAAWALWVWIHFQHLHDS